MRKPMTIGQLARDAGVGVETVRYYQRRGLIETPTRPFAGRRLYSHEALVTIAFIRRAQALGFSLEEIKGLLAISDAKSCAEGREHAHAKCEELGDRIKELERMRRRLTAWVKRCDANRRGAPCPFIQALNGRGEAES
jgi:MerR family mercuric resistance operon transcriptional regulator